MLSDNEERSVSPELDENTGLVAVYAVGCLAVVVILLAGICFA